MGKEISLNVHEILHKAFAYVSGFAKTIFLLQAKFYGIPAQVPREETSRNVTNIS